MDSQEIYLPLPTGANEIEKANKSVNDKKMEELQVEENKVEQKTDQTVKLLPPKYAINDRPRRNIRPTKFIYYIIL